MVGRDGHGGIVPSGRIHQDGGSTEGGGDLLPGLDETLFGGGVDRNKEGLAPRRGDPIHALTTTSDMASRHRDARSGRGKPLGEGPA